MAREYLIFFLNFINDPNDCENEIKSSYLVTKINTYLHLHDVDKRNDAEEGKWKNCSKKRFRRGIKEDVVLVQKASK